MRRWLATPNPELDGASPEGAALSPDGLNKVMSILMTVGGRVSGDFMHEGGDLPVQERDSLQGLEGLKNLKGMFGRTSKHISIEDMNAAIARRGAGKK